MLYVADPRPVADIRDAFDSRLPAWSPGAAHWLCLVVRDRYTHAPWASPAISTTLPTALKRVFCSLPGRRAKVTAMSLCARCAITLSPPAASGGLRQPSPRATWRQKSAAKVGFHQEGELRECYWLNGRWHNDWLFGLLRRDYHQPGPSGE
jgi:hypothetical protein